jgi:BlaI family penicillinase repressor
MKPRLDVTDTELAILEVLWSAGKPVAIAVMVEALYAERSISAHATVQSLLGRLEAKGCVVRRRDGRAHLYRAVVGREEVIGHQLRSLADRLCEGSLTPLLTHLVQASELSAEERSELRGMLETLEGTKRKTKRRP